MKGKAKKELHTKTMQELKTLLREVKEELFKLKLEHARRKLKNISLIRQKKEDVSRISTILREKEIQNENI